jgi:hypothetical protein
MKLFLLIIFTLLFFGTPSAKAEGTISLKCGPVLPYNGKNIIGAKDFDITIEQEAGTIKFKQVSWDKPYVYKIFENNQNTVIGTWLILKPEATVLHTIIVNKKELDVLRKTLGNTGWDRPFRVLESVTSKYQCVRPF